MSKPDKPTADDRVSEKAGSIDSTPAESAKTTAQPDQSGDSSSPEPTAKPADADRPKEIGGPKGPEPTRFGDWERDGRCVDF